MGVRVGDAAPPFTLYSSEKKEVSLHDFRGRNLVLLFYPFAFSGTCTKELCRMRDDLSVYNGLNAAILGVSVDSVFAQKRYKEEQQLNFELLSDFNKEVSAAYGSLYDDFLFGTKGVSKRSAFVIDAQGIIRHLEILENAGDQPDYEALQNCLKSLSATNA